MQVSVRVRQSLLLAAAMSVVAPAALAVQVSAPAILQWFESPWETISRRTPDLFNAGYGSLWTPPPGRAIYLAQGGGIGYDPYNRFDLGKPRDATIYGTENSYKAVVQSTRRMGGSVYVDYVHHHLGSLDLGLNGYTYPSSLTNAGAPYLQDKNDYPGFEMSDPNNKVGDAFARDTYAALYGANAASVPFGNVYEYWFRLGENLVTLDLASQGSLNRKFVRNPIPGNSDNIAQSNANWAIPTASVLGSGTIGADSKLRRANVADAGNARFYPDRDGPSRIVRDGGVNYTVYDFNATTLLAGDAIKENPVEYMMRYAQWLTQSIGVDGLRIDAARHVPLGEFNSGYNPQSLNVPNLIDRAVAGASSRINLDGTRRGVFQLQEIFNYDPNFLEGFVRKSQPAGDTVNPNRDVLDFSMWKAMAQYMGSNGSNNDWFQIRSASMNASVYNTLDSNIANNGDNGIGFVYNHDEGVSPPGTGGTIVLDNVAHAWTLMRPGNAYVYYRGNEFDRSNSPNFFLKQGRGDALGGQFGKILTTLTDVRNSYGRGDFIERWIDNSSNPGLKSAVYVFERKGSAVVGLNVGYNPGVASRTVQTSFVAGTRLEEVTGNWQDPSGLVSQVVTVNGTGQVTIPIPWNNAGNGNKGYVVYGLPRPRGAMSITTNANANFGTFGNEVPTLNPDPAKNGTYLISNVDVVNTPQFKIRMFTNAVTLADGFRDTFADGDRGLFKIDDGLDANNNGVFDNPSSALNNTTKYGFESFLTTSSPGFTSGGAGTFEQTVNATNLVEGYHYITSRIWRTQGINEEEVFQDFRRAIYVDLVPPTVSVDSTAAYPYQSDDKSRDIRVKSTDATADSVHLFMNLPASLSTADIIALVNGSNKSDAIDQALFGKKFDNVARGNHVITSVTYEPTGNKSVQRFVGNYIGTSRGAGLGDVDFSGTYTTGDVGSFESVLYTQNTQFNPAGDINADGLVDNLDLFSLPGRYFVAGASSPVIAAAKDAIKRRGDLNGNYTTFANAADVDHFQQSLGSLSWKYDLDAAGNASNANDLDILIRTILSTEYGDANVDGRVNTIDFNNLAGNFGLVAGAVWTQGNFNVDGMIDSTDFNLLAANYGFIAPVNAPTTLGAVVPEPGSLGLGLGMLCLLPRRGTTRSHRRR